ncbi:lipase family protein [Pseudomonas sp. SWRI154]|uniref:lipase family protein n=1 Tax=Pseudomonas sp. SWRI154 TaxID=2745501 RepID=UPI001648CF78|nr:lipase family protein [Pseudomonas sp. SWRI154]MBC3363617.1 lipase family protein [Pseudomonas sp. SWRI154]
MTLSKTELAPLLSSRVFACPVAGKWTSFQLVDESGAGEPYAWLAYVVTDSEGQTYRGNLDASGTGKVDDHFAGPIALYFDQDYRGVEKAYSLLQSRPHYPLKITELQVRAEKTRYLNDNATRTREPPAQACAGQFFQVEVRDLVKHVAHLPPQVYRHYPPNQGAARLMGEFGKVGVTLASRRHTVLEVRPLRALRPMLSLDPEFCALNLYQLALMATLSYCPFGQEPGQAPINTPVSFPEQPSVGNWFGDALAKSEELWRVDPGQTKSYYPLYEDVPYSKRLEIVPFDPALYPVNNPELGTKQEHPAQIHFLDDTADEESTDTQAFITHSDEVILIAVRGTAQMLADGLRDADALQVPFEEGLGKVHQGFYGAAKIAAAFVIDYLERFYAGQKLLICGHSLGGAAALLLAEMLRLRKGFNYNIQLYTYGAPRAADASFVKNAEPLVHYRMVNHNDPVPSVPGSWMDTKTSVYGTGLTLAFANVPVGFSVFVAGIYNWTGEPYEHHGTLRHFLPVEFSRREQSSILWTPGCDTLTQHAACEIALQHRRGLPDRPGFLAQFFQAGNHLMTSSYVPACWATLRRWQEAQESSSTLVTQREYERIEDALAQVTQQLRNERRHMLARPDAYVRTHQSIIDALNREVDKVHATRARLTALSTLLVTAKDVYGSLSEHFELALNLSRWQAHPENRVAEQLAIAPAADVDTELIHGAHGYVIGKPYTLDIDSII